MARTLKSQRIQDAFIRDYKSCSEETMPHLQMQEILQNIGKDEKILIEVGHMQFLPILDLKHIILENGEKQWAIITRTRRRSCEICGKRRQGNPQGVFNELCTKCRHAPLRRTKLHDLHDENGVIIGVWCRSSQTEDIFRALCERDQKKFSGGIRTALWRAVPCLDEDGWADTLIIRTRKGGSGAFQVTFHVFGNTWENKT